MNGRWPWVEYPPPYRAMRGSKTDLITSSGKDTNGSDVSMCASHEAFCGHGTTTCGNDVPLPSLSGYTNLIAV